MNSESGSQSRYGSEAKMKLERMAKIIVRTQDRVRSLDGEQLVMLTGLIKLLRLISDLRRQEAETGAKAQGDASEE